MKKFTKRILATVLAACLLLCLGVPVARAAEETAQNSGENVAKISVAYDFYNPVYKISEGGKTDPNTAAKIEAYATLYAQGTINNHFVGANSIKDIPYITNTADWAGYMHYSKVGDWIAVKLASPGTGTFTVSLDYYRNVNNAKEVSFYILPGDTAVENIATALKTAAAIGTADVQAGTGVQTAELGDSTFEAGKDYILVMKATRNRRNKDLVDTTSETNARMHMIGLDMAAQVATLEDAQAMATTPFHTITLLKDAQSQTALTLASGVTLDLNGKTLTADVKADLGTVTDTTNGEGAIVGASNVVNTGKNEVALMKDNVCRVFDYALTVDGTAEEKTVEEKKQVSFWFHIELNAAAYTMLSEGATGLTVGANMQWTPAGGAAASKKVELAKTEVTKWAGLMSSGDYWFYVNVTGFESLTETGSLDVVPTINAVAGNAITYSVN